MDQTHVHEGLVQHPGTALAFRTAGLVARTSLRWLPKSLTHNYLNTWARQRDLPPAPAKSFREQYRQRKQG